MRIFQSGGVEIGTRVDKGKAILGETVKFNGCSTDGPIARDVMTRSNISRSWNEVVIGQRHRDTQARSGTGDTFWSGKDAQAVKIIASHDEEVDDVALIPELMALTEKKKKERRCQLCLNKSLGVRRWI